MAKLDLLQKKREEPWIYEVKRKEKSNARPITPEGKVVTKKDEAKKLTPDGKVVTPQDEAKPVTPDGTVLKPMQEDPSSDLTVADTEKDKQVQSTPKKSDQQVEEAVAAEAKQIQEEL